MAHFKCMTCKVRVHVAGRPADLAGDPCPGCGSALEPAGSLAELVGFRAQAQAPRRAGSPGDGGGVAAAEAVALPRPETNC